jgi:hypothetical protein
MAFYIIEGKVYRASCSREAKDLMKTTEKGKRLQNRGRPITIGKTYKN